MTSMRFADLGVISFAEALRRQEETVEEIACNGHPETVYLLEHPHVYTIGRAGKTENLLLSSEELECIELHRINRGGDITYHGPGQLVGYPHLDLRKRDREVHGYLRGLEKALIRTAARFGIRTFARPGLTGVWTEAGKLASIGVGIRHWITMHGFALNVSTDLAYFRRINPCGIRDCPVTSLNLLLGRGVEMDEVKQVFMDCFERVFEAPEQSRDCQGAAGS